MPIVVNIRHLERHPLRVEGELSPAELDLGRADELMRPAGPLEYVFEAERHEQGILVRGSLVLPLDCECSRCLRPFRLEVCLPDWTRLVPWEGEDAARVENDCVDLTPQVREDIVLALPQRPLCKPECGGLPGKPAASSNSPTAADFPADSSPAWRELDKLNL